MTRLMTWAMLILAGAGLWMGGTSLAQEAQRGDVDRDFIKIAASNNQAEIQLGKLAAERGSNAQVRDFAKRLEKDHTQANVELLKITTAQGIELSRDMGPYQEAANQLAQLHGAEFDRAFVRRMVKAHEEAITHFTTEAKQGRNAELKAYAAKVLPILQEHLQLARDLAAKH
jgi:putative membrane protein